MIDQVKQRVNDYKAFYEKLIRRSYTIGGMIIFPKHTDSINQNRGTNKLISDRWDLTLECIRLYYNGKTSPLYDTLDKDKEFFRLFRDFNGYVDFFYLQDAVTDDYSKVRIWCGDSNFVEDGLPRTIEDYFSLIEKEYAFLERRNCRINECYNFRNKNGKQDNES